MSDAIGRYALIKSSIVRTVSPGSASFVQELVNSGAIDEGVLLSEGQVVNPGDKYENGAFVTALTKLQAVGVRSLELAAELRAIRDSHYDEEVLKNFDTLYKIALRDGLANQKAYIDQLLDWAKLGMTVFRDARATMLALSTAQEVMDYKWDLSGFAAANPRITVIDALEILD